ncbi:protein phosphatase 2C domain-containing protein [Segetibacter sp. 3557_3]|uniref:PP2C family serine/threonine-protein phosphatase n=1 Tax=Segetibacter sp. 3557_3 TaxID=2547429 RepID=UPI0010588C29|nr:PP2C family serine/threonine-protein phosphatase [Segetibacter sp. 3557_3]TDH20650.1 protein phosphatase 2C domain-containing protein [Segetibacter sp. 3557_3]
MADAKKIVQVLFEANNIPIPPNRAAIFEQFIKKPGSEAVIRALLANQTELMEKWKLENRIMDIAQQPVRILNATVGKPYETWFDFDQLKWKDIAAFEFTGLEDIGLTFDPKTSQLSGVPAQSGDYKLLFRYRLQEEPEDAPYHEKVIPIIINPDPKSLWKKLDSNQQDPYWKEDDVTAFEPLGDRSILVSSKRGRSHANVGSFREDDFAFKALPGGWNIVVVADGAGSAKISRKGSALACNTVVEYFLDQPAVEGMAVFDELLKQYKTDNSEIQKKINQHVYNNLGKAALHVHKKLIAFAAEVSVPVKDLNTTLIFTLFKKYETGYALLSFGVGDCPIALLNKDVSEVTLMNWIDVGEFGGGTRFITMPEIFHDQKFATRFGFKVVEDFSYLIMMSDGIYDAKFVVEANLPNIKKWKEFLADLGGKNEDGISVALSTANPDIVSQFSAWMDFWSPGNHDDRTLAIVF